MDTEQIEKLACIGVGKRWVGDPAFDRDDLYQIARMTVWKNRDRHPGRIVLAVRDAVRRVRLSAQVQMRQRQEVLSTDYSVHGRECEPWVIAVAREHDTLRPRRMPPLPRQWPSKRDRVQRKREEIDGLKHHAEILSDSQKEIIHWTSLGLSARQISRKLAMPETAVKLQRENAMVRMKEANGNS